jgi:hypothetical protein
MTLDEAARQLQQATHDAQVAFDCIGLGEIDRAHTHAVTAKAAVAAAEVALDRALHDLSPAEAAREGSQAFEQIEDREATH